MNSPAQSTPRIAKPVYNVGVNATGPLSIESAKPENRAARAVIDCCYKIHKELGPGLLESLYEAALAHELVKLGHVVRRQQPIPVVYDGIKFQEGFRADLLVDNVLIVEIKSIEAVAPIHFKILMTYLRLSNIRLGLMVNFNEVLLKNGIKRLANGL